MDVLPQYMISKWVLPHLKNGTRGSKMSEQHLIRLVEAIFYKLKTGVQWRFLPIQQFFDTPYTYKSVFFHFAKWVKDGSWQAVWQNLVKMNRNMLDLSNFQLDATHTPCKRGGEKVSYQG